eukprot:jgi/Botrbrau1/6978/Bobra.0165s0014.1
MMGSLGGVQGVIGRSQYLVQHRQYRATPQGLSYRCTALCESVMSCTLLPGSPQLVHPAIHPVRQKHGTYYMLSIASKNRSRSCTLPKAAAAAAAADAVPRSSSNRPNPVLKFVLDQFLPIVLLAGIALGYILPGVGLVLSDLGFQTWSTFAIFVISGLNLRRKEAERALSARAAIAFGVVSILLLTPLMSLAVLQLPLAPRELAIGLAVFCCMPTTLSTGIAMTEAVGGNTALALLLTVATNLLGIFTMPFILCSVLGSAGSAVKIAPAPLLKSLIKSILIPLLIGAGARAYVPGVASFAFANRKQLSIVSALFLGLVPWMQISRAVTSNVSITLSGLLSVMAVGMIVHIVYLAANITAVHVLQLGGKTEDDEVRGVRRALVLVTSQKTLPIAATVLSQLAGVLPGPVGLAVIPCIAAHIEQILFDSMLVAHWLKSDRDAKAKPA